MRVVLFHDEAEADLVAQVAYLIEQGASQAALDFEVKVPAFISKTLQTFPYAGHATSVPDVFECAIPNSRIVIWYMVTADALIIVDVWHASQDRGLPRETIR